MWARALYLSRQFSRGNINVIMASTTIICKQCSVILDPTLIAKFGAFCERCFKEDRKRYSAEYRIAHKEELATKRAAKYQANKTQVATAQKAYRESNKERIKLQKAAKYQESKEHVLEVCRLYQESHKEQISAAHAAYYQAHKEEHNAKTTEYYRTHADEISAQRKLKRQTDPLSRQKDIDASC